MADHYVKLWASILDSSVWSEPESHRIVWITMLAMKDKTGFVGASVDGLARRANIDEARVREALASFMAPDPNSRNSENEGRRIQEVPRGWHILNNDYFQHLQDQEARRAYERDRKAEQRKRVVPECPGQDMDTKGQMQICPPPVTGTGTASGTSEKRSVPRPDDVSEQTWEDWLAHRRKNKSTVNATVLKRLRSEASKAGVSLDDAMATSVANGWKGYNADWVAGKGGGKIVQQRGAGETRNGSYPVKPVAVIHDPDDPACDCERCYTARRRAEGYGERIDPATTKGRP